MARRRQKAEKEPQVIEMDFPVLSTDVQLGVLSTPEGAYAILNCSTVLQRGTFAIDRSQAIQLGSELLKMAEKMPREKKESKLAVVERGGLIVPEGI